LSANGLIFPFGWLRNEKSPLNFEAFNRLGIREEDRTPPNPTWGQPGCNTTRRS
jgi:hypothetical protein